MTPISQEEAEVFLPVLRRLPELEKRVEDLSHALARHFMNQGEVSQPTTEQDTWIRHQALLLAQKNRQVNAQTQVQWAQYYEHYLRTGEMLPEQGKTTVKPVAGAGSTVTLTPDNLGVLLGLDHEAQKAYLDQIWREAQ